MSVLKEAVRVWDPFVRVFHWSLATAWLASWLTAEAWAGLHEQLGYFILALLGLRLLWGIIGTSHARFSDFVRSPSTTLAYIQSLFSGRPQHVVGHNPAGGWMILVLMLTLTFTAVSGVMMAGSEGPLEAVHEALANLSIVLVALHLVGIVVGGVLHGEKLVRAMITGNKPRRTTDV